MDLSFKDTAEKSEGELTKLAGDTRQELRSLALKASSQELKDVRSIRTLRRTLARIMTRLAAVRRQKSS